MFQPAKKRVLKHVAPSTASTAQQTGPHLQRKVRKGRVDHPNAQLLFHGKDKTEETPKSHDENAYNDWQPHEKI